MENILRTSVMGLFFGTFGTTIGGIIGISFNKTSNKFLGFILSLVSGIMISVVCFDLIPTALDYAKMPIVILAIGIGVATMIICDVGVQEKINNNKSKLYSNSEKERLLKTGIIVSLGLALHNIPEGLAIRSGI